MEAILHAISEPWAIRALIVSGLIGLMYGVLGSFVVLRNMSLIGDALSHSILPGVFFAFIIVGYSSIGFFVGSVIAGLATALLITMIQQYIKTKSDAAIGIVFTVMFSIGVIGISWLNNEQGVHLDLKDFLVGNVMGISDDEIILTFLVTIYTIGSVLLFYRYLFITTFQPVIAKTMGISTQVIHYFLMLMLSFAIVAGLKTVGVILVVALLITPSSTALLLSSRLKRVVLISAVLGVLSTTLGLLFAILFDTPPGPAMVIISAIFFLFAALFSPEKGLVSRFIRKRNQRIKIQREDILRHVIKFKQDQTVSNNDLSEALSIPVSSIKKRIQSLKNDGLLIKSEETKLTARGRLEAESLVRAHRLWESYQVTSMGLTEGQIHEEADWIEHLLTEEILDEVDARLGFPKTDPHGSPIPEKSSKKGTLLTQRPNARVKVIKDQINNDIESELWELGIMPNSYVIVKKITDRGVVLKYQQSTIEVDAEIAKKVIVKK